MPGLVRKSLVAGAALSVLATPAAFACSNIPAGSTVAVGRYTAANDVPNLLSNDAPLGKVVFWQQGTGTINYRIRVTGLSANTQYFPVPYKDPFCAPAPGVSAFPGSPFKTDATGAAVATGTVNPTGLNPAGQFTLDQTKSISLRRVLGSVNLPTSTPPFPLNSTYNLPNPVPESCDGAPTVRTK